MNTCLYHLRNDKNWHVLNMVATLPPFEYLFKPGLHFFEKKPAYLNKKQLLCVIVLFSETLSKNQSRFKLLYALNSLKLIKVN